MRASERACVCVFNYVGGCGWLCSSCGGHHGDQSERRRKQTCAWWGGYSLDHPFHLLSPSVDLLWTCGRLASPPPWAAVKCTFVPEYCSGRAEAKAASLWKYSRHGYTKQFVILCHWWRRIILKHRRESPLPKPNTECVDRWNRKAKRMEMLFRRI